ncbi:MAG: hypothetical protein U1C33_04035, partial [Candidatus Cloacimonadaceae bacterium]|nr:hypothetical protein [Candidatus Cloacimonadaceae bacterium]
MNFTELIASERDRQCWKNAGTFSESPLRGLLLLVYLAFLVSVLMLLVSKSAVPTGSLFLASFLFACGLYLYRRARYQHQEMSLSPLGAISNPEAISYLIHDEINTAIMQYSHYKDSKPGDYNSSGTTPTPEGMTFVPEPPRSEEENRRLEKENKELKLLLESEQQFNDMMLSFMREEHSGGVKNIKAMVGLFADFCQADFCALYSYNTIQRSFNQIERWYKKDEANDSGSNSFRFDPQKYRWAYQRVKSGKICSFKKSMLAELYI